VIIVSVPHTGTRFLKKRLGIKDHIHTVALWEHLLEKTEGRTIISPLRNPVSVWRSTTRRWVTPDIPLDTHSFLRSWYMLHALSLVRDIDFIAIDKQQDERITDWAPVGKGDEGRAVHPDIDLKPLYELPFIKEFYQ